jgi:hypothetical protein
MKLLGVLAVGGFLVLFSPVIARCATVIKTNPIPVYVHYMPWFQTPQTLGGNNWGFHWKMNDRNPNIVDSNGQREIASNYYPLIGPYDSSDPYVIEYHMLLMKLSGIDGVIVDWYGTHGTNGDIPSLLSASNKIVAATQTYGLQVGVTLEDRFASSTSDVTANLNYLAANYYTQSNYIRVGANNTPLTTVFGPITYQQPSDWTKILSGASTKPALVTLPSQASQIGSAAVGEMGWIFQDPGTSDHLSVQQNFLAHEAGKFPNSIGVAYAGYNDYYAQGNDGAGAGFVIPESDPSGSTLSETLALDEANKSKISAIQLATWNDFGEGTQLEPTVQDGFSDLEEIQKFTGVPYGLSQLELVYNLYEAREQFLGNTSKESLLDQAASDINNLDFTDAQNLINQATGVPEPIMLPMLAAMFALHKRRAN